MPEKLPMATAFNYRGHLHRHMNAAAILPRIHFSVSTVAPHLALVPMSGLVMPNPRPSPSTDASQLSPFAASVPATPGAVSSCTLSVLQLPSAHATPDHDEAPLVVPIPILFAQPVLTVHVGLSTPTVPSNAPPTPLYPCHVSLPSSPSPCHVAPLSLRSGFEGASIAAQPHAWTLCYTPLLTSAPHAQLHRVPAHVPPEEHPKGVPTAQSLPASQPQKVQYAQVPNAPEMQSVNPLTEAEFLDPIANAAFCTMTFCAQKKVHLESAG